MKKEKNILITGGCGFIGVNFVNYLVKNNYHSVRILDNLSTGKKENLENALQEIGRLSLKTKNNKNIYILTKKHGHNLREKSSIELITGDIRAYDSCLESTKNVDSIVHLAAHAGVLPSIEDPFHDCDVNVKGTLNLLLAAVKNRVARFIFASSNAPLGDQQAPMNEEKIPKPLSPYGASKMACEGYCSAFYSSFGLKTVILRFSNVYGPYCLHKGSVIAKFIKEGFTKQSIAIYGDGKQTRDFIHAADLSQAIHLILSLPFSQQQGQAISPSTPSSIWGNVFHIGSGKETSIIHLANSIQKLFKKEIKIHFKPANKGEIRRNYSDISRAKKMLGFTPKIELEKGLKETYNWIKENTRNLSS